ncbi:24729_t:CDS:2 [Entrophospora sp. SA101]|nr:12987_t:CDS:2 [Entrophospora candida]CAG8501537.1 5413_t:CDS:2 [Entrophospora candida]CAJ0755763.1 24729_t:CDS:2 [Entrophospora sp. SA101]
MLKFQLLVLISFTLTAFLITLLPTIQAAKVIPFCKCTCGENSTIFALEVGTLCSECNKAFCIQEMGDECSGVNNDDSGNVCDIQAIATCFERDSYKDEAIVYFYIIITCGLLFAALIKPFIEEWLKRTNFYSSMPNS